MKLILLGLVAAATLMCATATPAMARRYRVVYPVYPVRVYYPRRVYYPAYPVYPAYPAYPVYYW
jgi:hypothetical protein